MGWKSDLVWSLYQATLREKKVNFKWHILRTILHQIWHFPIFSSFSFFHIHFIYETINRKPCKPISDSNELFWFHLNWIERILGIPRKRIRIASISMWVCARQHCIHIPSTSCSTSFPKNHLRSSKPNDAIFLNKNIARTRSLTFLTYAEFPLIVYVMPFPVSMDGTEYPYSDSHYEHMFTQNIHFESVIVSS